MGDHFRLRKAADLQTAHNTATRTHLRVIHAVSFVSILLAAQSVGLSLYNASKTSTNLDVAGFQQNEKKPTKDYDKYRGYKKVKGEALGYFSLQRTDNGKWSLITPEGNAFFGMGLNKIYTWNIEPDAYKEKFNNDHTTWAIETTKLLDSLRFNTLGNNTLLSALIQPKVLRFPFTLSGEYVKWESGERIAENDFPDVWSEEFAGDVDIKTRKMSQQYGSDPYLALAWPANEMHFNLQNVNGEADPASVYWKKLVQEAGKTPAKEVWVGLYQTRYNNDIAAVNAVYGTTMTAFDDMYTLGFSLYNRFATIEEGEEADGQKAYQDIDDWSTEIAEQFHKVIYTSIKTSMPNVIVTSERLVQANHSPLYFEKIKPYIDALAINMYISAENVAPSTYTLDRYTAMVDNKPIVISEHSYLQEPCNVSDDGGTYPGVPTQADRAAAHKAYRDSILEHPAVTYLAFHEYTDVRSKTNTCGYTNFGLVSRQAEPYQEMIDAGIATWQNFDELRWKTEMLVDATKGFQQPDVITNTDTGKSNEPLTNVNGALNPITNTNTAGNFKTNTNTGFSPTTNTNTASNFKTNTNTAANPFKDVGQILKPIVGVTSGAKFKTNTNTSSNFQTNTNTAFRPTTNTNTAANPITNTNTAANPITNTNTAPNRATQTDISLNLPDQTDGAADLAPNGSTLAGFFAAPTQQSTSKTPATTQKK